MYSEDKGRGPGQPKFTLDLDGLIAWLDTQDPNRSYDWFDFSGGCLFSRFFAACGEDHDYWESNHIRGLEHIAFMQPWTYGEELIRAKTARALLILAASLAREIVYGE